MNINSTDFGNSYGQHLSKCIKEPIVIERSGKPFAVLVSHDEFQVLRQAKEILEDQYWAQQAEEARKEPSLSAEETEAFLKSMLDSDD